MNPLNTTRRRRSAEIGFLAAALLVLAACGGAEDETSDAAPEDTTAGEADVEEQVSDDIEPLTVRFYSAFAENNTPFVVAYDILAGHVADLSGGAMEVDWVAGPESIDPFETAQAIEAGTVDMALASAAYYLSGIPHAIVLNFSTLTPSEERESGAYELLDDFHQQQLGAKYLGRASYGMSYSLFTKEAVTSIDDFDGMRFRTTPSYMPFTNLLGIEPVSMPWGETYTALERGVVEGFTSPELGVIDLGLADQISYQILPTFWGVDETFMLNMNFWESLSPEQQNVLIEAAILTEEDLPAAYDDLRVREAEGLAEAGVEPIEIEEADEYLNMAQTGGANWMRENIDPDDAEALIEAFGVER